MDFFYFLLIFFVLFASARLLETHLRTKRSNVDEKEYGQMQSRLGRLEDRVRVLERIVTDRNLDLEREFKQLDD